MLDTWKELLGHQFDAALCTLNACIQQCPDDTWGTPIANLKFGQVVFHTLFFTDYYLGLNEDALRDQPFHRQHAETFGDYEELQDRAQQTLHDRPFIDAYLQHCREKASDVIASETADTLQARAGFPGRHFSRAELHVYNIRHIQHHAAQLSLRLRLDAGVGIPWFGSGWCEEAT